MNTLRLIEVMRVVELVGLPISDLDEGETVTGAHTRESCRVRNAPKVKPTTNERITMIVLIVLGVLVALVGMLSLHPRAIDVLMDVEELAQLNEVSEALSEEDAR